MQTSVGKHFAANFVVKGVGVKTLTALVANYLALAFSLKKVQSIRMRSKRKTVGTFS